MCVYLSTKFQNSSIILTIFRQRVILPPPLPLPPLQPPKPVPATYILSIFLGEF